MLTNNNEPYTLQLTLLGIIATVEFCRYTSGSHDYNVTEVICAAAVEHSLYERICQMACMGKIIVGGGCQKK
jgi:hypothetical protein